MVPHLFLYEGACGREGETEEKEKEKDREREGEGDTQHLRITTICGIVSERTLLSTIKEKVSSALLPTTATGFYSTTTEHLISYVIHKLTKNQRLYPLTPTGQEAAAPWLHTDPYKCHLNIVC